MFVAAEPEGLFKGQRAVWASSFTRGRRGKAFPHLLSTLNAALVHHVAAQRLNVPSPRARHISTAHAFSPPGGMAGPRFHVSLPVSLSFRAGTVASGTSACIMKLVSVVSSPSADPARLSRSRPSLALGNLCNLQQRVSSLFARQPRPNKKSPNPTPLATGRRLQARQ